MGSKIFFYTKGLFKNTNGDSFTILFPIWMWLIYKDLRQMKIIISYKNQNKQKAVRRKKSATKKKKVCMLLWQSNLREKNYFFGLSVLCLFSLFLSFFLSCFLTCSNGEDCLQKKVPTSSVCTNLFWPV